MKRIFFTLFAICAIFALLTLSVGAENGVGVELPEEDWENFRGSIPESVEDRLPDGALDGTEGFFEGVSEMSTAEYVVTVIFDAVGAELGGVARLALVLFSLLLLSAVFNTAGESMGNPSLSVALRFCSSGAVISAVIYTQYSHFAMLEEFFGELGVMMNGMIPVTASIWAMGGNVSTASVGSASFYVILSVCQRIWSSTLIPVCCVLTVLGFCDALSDEVKTGRIMNAVKKIYNFVLGLVMTVLLSSLGAQTSLAAAADTAAARAARLVSGTVIPVVGGGVGETFRTLAGGVSYLKSVFGIGGIIAIAVLVLPVAISLLLTRFVFLITAGIADMLGCQNEARLLENLGEVYGSMLAVSTSVAITFVFALCIFMQTVVAVT